MPLLLTTIIFISCSPKNKETETIISRPIPSEEISSIYELRTYYAADGKLESLLSRFRDHTTSLFEKHGMTNVAYWTPSENTDNILVYLMAYPSKEARDKSWETFINDLEWTKVWEASKVDGPLVDSIAQIFLTPTDFSPELEIEDMGNRIFEMRTYYTHQGKLPNLHARFRDHTIDLFEKHNINNLVYFNYETDMNGSENTLLYFITHPDRESAKNNWQAFIQDTDWRQAYEASRIDGSLVDSLTSLFMIPTNFSPLK